MKCVTCNCSYQIKNHEANWNWKKNGSKSRSYRIKAFHNNTNTRANSPPRRTDAMQEKKGNIATSMTNRITLVKVNKITFLCVSSHMRVEALWDPLFFLSFIFTFLLPNDKSFLTSLHFPPLFVISLLFERYKYIIVKKKWEKNSKFCVILIIYYTSLNFNVFFLIILSFISFHSIKLTLKFKAKCYLWSIIF